MKIDKTIANRLKFFLNYPFVISHFENPEKVGTPQVTVNPDGSDLIIDKLLRS